ncbi:hypothetical protein LZ578_07335 [Jeotgalibaca sp. MA1X17-3]|uniref:hypothetical protein n=1 Tax=Jeotgalibaca sp. MA1X17-3 TaxID=2908211 RepID=UPI001F26DB17|nr:hypothetical protein [Jeotgalibaca sp. MA1X17-3]UJF14831.1 hypothetical protein LZ578_07335 [Jeotgalibaca sp. MA1X17-3]
MKLKWNRLSLSLLLVMFLVLVAVLFYGDQYILTTVKEQAEQSTSLVDQQKTLMATYPPEGNILQEYEENYEETWDYLPEGEKVNQEMVALEKAAKKENITLNQITRTGEPQLLEDIGNSYMKSVYQVDITSEKIADMQNLLDNLLDFERIWNVYAFSFQKNGENNYQGSFTFELFYHVENTTAEKE